MTRISSTQHAPRRGRRPGDGDRRERRGHDGDRDRRDPRFPQPQVTKSVHGRYLLASRDMSSGRAA